MRTVFYILLYLPIFVFSSNSTSVDLEEEAQDFVLETKKIEIPGHPYAFNPGIIRWHGQLLLSFRIVPQTKNSWNSDIGLVWLNEEFLPVSEPQILSLRDEYSRSPSRAGDARLLTIKERLFLIYEDNTEKKISAGGFRIYVAELLYDGEHFIANSIEGLKIFEGESWEKREKNWVPFESRGNLLFAYSLVPHRIFYPYLDGTERCETIASSKGSIDWDWGVLRGGTPGLTIDDSRFLSFFHSSKKMVTAHSGENKVLHYFMGAYTFSSFPPYEILQISPEPIIGKNFYKGVLYKPYWHPIRGIFPCGFVFDENHIWVAYGREDHECWIAKLDKKELLQSLIPVRP